MPDRWTPETPAVVAWIERAAGPGARVTRVEPMASSTIAEPGSRGFERYEDYVETVLAEC